jgi:hypothetical protein
MRKNEDLAESCELALAQEDFLREIEEKPSREMATTPCRAGIACENRKCGFRHPEERTSSYIVAAAAAIKKKNDKEFMARTPCKKGRRCRAHRCGFLHPKGHSTSYSA